MYQSINLDKNEIDEHIKRNKINQSIREIYSDMILTKTATDGIKKELKSALNYLKYSHNETYIFLFQDNSVLLYGLYKGKDSKIYLIKSFMNTIIIVVKFDRNLLNII